MLFNRLINYAVRISEFLKIFLTFYKLFIVILDLMNGGDLHYHLSQHGVFSESEVLFYGGF